MDSRQMNSAEIEETAAAWLAKRDRDSWSEADEAEFALWLKSSTAHRVAFIRLDAMWREANRLKALGAGVRPGAVPIPGEWRLSPFSHTRLDEPPSDCESWQLLDRADVSRVTAATRSPRVNRCEPLWRSLIRSRALAASVTVAMAAGIGGYLLSAGPPAYRTAVGGVEAVALSDGSNVTLNTNSEIRVVVTDTQRRVDLKRGEAFFEVAKDSARPFVVMAGGQRIVAVGTQFSVRRSESDADEVSVVVTEGRVRVGPAAGAAAALPPAEVAAGSIARSGAAGVLIQPRPARPVEDYVSWRSGYLVFHETAMAEVVAEFNRYNTTKLVINDSTVASIHIGGNFRSTNVEAFVRLLEDGFAAPIRVERRGEQIVLSADESR